MNIIFGAQYEAHGRLYRLLGAKTGRLLFQDEVSGEIIEEPRASAERFQPTGVHDHVDFCCPEHNLHVSPHRGCILR